VKAGDESNIYGARFFVCRIGGLPVNIVVGAKTPLEFSKTIIPEPVKKAGIQFFQRRIDGCAGFP
jgi:hypothetical protein